MDAPYSFDLGDHIWPVSTDNATAQLWFDRGLNWLYGFNHEEAVTCFKHAAKEDPRLAMAWWGIAYASGPFYNMPWRVFTDAEAVQATKVCYEAAQSALRFLEGATSLEAALIQAVAQRYQKPVPVTLPEFQAWDRAYAEAMRGVYREFPENDDVVALTAEALMVQTPWALWDVKSGKPAEGAATLEALAILKTSIERATAAKKAPHPAVLHLHIHVLEMSDTPQDALVSAGWLLDMMPDAGHMQHMPAHIYSLCGMFHEAIACSWKSVRADQKYVAHAGTFNFYTTARCHDLHMLMYAAMMAGRYDPAIWAGEQICATLTREVLSTDKNHMAITMEGYHATKMHVLVRFGRWQDIVDTELPDDPVLYCVTTAMHRYARGVAYAAMGQVAEAEAEREHFRAAVAAVPENRLYFNNQARDILAVGEEMLNGELEYRKGNYDQAFEHLRQAAHLDDNLFYTEPWAWMHPPRHALGALMIEQGHLAEAEAAYRADLGFDATLPRCCQHPENVWALHGFAECLRRRGDTAELPMITQRLAMAMARADIKIESSCCCRKDVG